MRDATVSGMRCAREHGAITRGKLGGAVEHVADELLSRAAPGSPVDAL